MRCVDFRGDGVGGMEGLDAGSSDLGVGACGVGFHPVACAEEFHGNETLDWQSMRLTAKDFPLLGSLEIRGWIAIRGSQVN